MNTSPRITLHPQSNQLSHGLSPRPTTDPRLGELFREVARLRAIDDALASIDAELEELRRPYLVLDEEGLVSGYLFGQAPCKPMYSTARLEVVHRITSDRDLKIAQLEREREVIVERYEAYQQELTDRLTPKRNRLEVPPFEAISIPLSCRDGFSDPVIKALYKSALKTIKRLTEGRR